MPGLEGCVGGGEELVPVEPVEVPCDDPAEDDPAEPVLEPDELLLSLPTMISSLV